jgi:CDP-paratose 2-epimerase
MFEAVRLCEEIAGKKLNWTYSEANRSGDHIWWISDVGKFKAHYPNWDFKYDIRDILEQIHTKIVERLRSSSGA